MYLIKNKPKADFSDPHPSESLIAWVERGYPRCIIAPKRQMLFQLKFQNCVLNYDLEIYKILSVIFGIIGAVPVLICAGIAVFA